MDGPKGQSTESRDIDYYVLYGLIKGTKCAVIRRVSLLTCHCFLQ